jgi:hypothetical protein
LADVEHETAPELIGIDGQSCVWMRGEGHGGTSTRYSDDTASESTAPPLEESTLGVTPCEEPTWTARNPYPIVCISNKDGLRDDREGIRGNIREELN